MTVTDGEGGPVNNPSMISAERLRHARSPQSLTAGECGSSLVRQGDGGEQLVLPHFRPAFGHQRVATEPSTCMFDVERDLLAGEPECANAPPHRPPAKVAVSLDGRRRTARLRCVE